MHDPSDILEQTLREAKRILHEMKKTTDLAQRKDQSEILRNLCRSAGVFFDLMTDTMMADGYADMDDSYLFEEEQEDSEPEPARNSRKAGRSDDSLPF